MNAIHCSQFNILDEQKQCSLTDVWKEIKVGKCEWFSIFLSSFSYYWLQLKLMPFGRVLMLITISSQIGENKSISGKRNGVKMPGKGGIPSKFSSSVTHTWLSWSLNMEVLIRKVSLEKLCIQPLSQACLGLKFKMLFLQQSAFIYPFACPLIFDILVSWKVHSWDFDILMGRDSNLLAFGKEMS